MTEPEQTYSAAGEVGQVRARRTMVQRMWLGLKKAPLSAWFGMIVIAFYFVFAVFAPDSGAVRGSPDIPATLRALGRGFHVRDGPTRA